MGDTYLTTIINEYNDIMIGKRKKFSSTCFSFAERQNEILAVGVFKYAIEKYLKWTPQQAVSNFNLKLLTDLNLNLLLSHISFPKELNPKEDFWYIVHLCYPTVIKCNKKELILDMYKKILEDDSKKFPKDYFLEGDGFIKAGVCLQYILQYYYGYKSISDYYEDFANEAKGNSILAEYKLQKVCEFLFPTPLDFLHFSLPDINKDEFLYQYYKYLNLKKVMLMEGDC